MSRYAIAPAAAACCVVLAACQSPSGPAASPPLPETASAAVQASSPVAPIRGLGLSPSLAGQSHWSTGQCTSNGAVKVCN
ncbi:hypothetical protein ACVBGC_16755 [Burkholderia stagnalis]